jgi:hypothetical protein
MVAATFRKPPVILKSNTITLFKNYLNFPASSPAYGTFYKITGSFLNAATSESKFCCGFRYLAAILILLTFKKIII